MYNIIVRIDHILYFWHFWGSTSFTSFTCFLLNYSLSTIPQNDPLIWVHAVTIFDTSGTFGSVHRLQLCNQPIHLPPLQFKFTKSTDDHQVCQITFHVSDNISDQKLHLFGVFTVTKKWREINYRNCCPMAICKTGNNISRWSTVQNLYVLMCWFWYSVFFFLQNKCFKRENLSISTAICQISDKCPRCAGNN